MTEFDFTHASIDPCKTRNIGQVSLAKRGNREGGRGDLTVLDSKPYKDNDGQMRASTCRKCYSDGFSLVWEAV